MCFPKAPKPPKAQNDADPELARERHQAELDNAALKAEDKEKRFEDKLTQLMGRYGRHSLFTGGQGGAGFRANTGRSLFVPNGGVLPGTERVKGRLAAPVYKHPTLQPRVPVTPGRPPFGGGGGGGGGGRRSIFQPAVMRQVIQQARS